MKNILSLALVLMMVTGCQTTTQTSSGRAYMDKNNLNTIPKSAQDPQQSLTAGLQSALAEAAMGEPNLKFPGRFGIVRIRNGRDITNIPREEMVHWQALIKTLPHNIGELVPVNPMIGDLVSTGMSLKNKENVQNNLISNIRLAAAKQHLDAVLIYETFTETTHQDNILEWTALTIVGHYIAPSEEIESAGYANAILIDVAQAYPYTSASGFSETLSSYSTGNSVRKTKRELADQATIEAVKDLTINIRQSFQELYRNLEHKKSES